MSEASLPYTRWLEWRLEQRHNGDDERTVGELDADHPLDEINLEFTQVGLGGKGRSIDLPDGFGDAFGLLGRKSALLQAGDQLMGVANNEGVHTRIVYHISVNVQIARRQPHTGGVGS